MDIFILSFAFMCLIYIRSWNMGAERASRERALQMDLMDIMDTQMLHSVLQTAFPLHSEIPRWPLASCTGRSSPLVL